MTWDELKEKAKEMGWTPFGTLGVEKIIPKLGSISCYFNGKITMYFGREDGGGYVYIAENRTPEQMLMIMRGLE